MAKSNLGSAIGESKELNFAASLFEKRQARADANEAAARAREERKAAEQDKRDQDRFDRLSKWIIVDESKIHSYWQPTVQEETTKFWNKVLDEYDKDKSYARSNRFNREFNDVMAKLSKYKKSSEDFSKDLLLVQQKPDDFELKPDFKKVVESGDPNLFQAYLKANGPTDAYITGQGVQQKFNEVEALKKLKAMTTPNKFSETMDIDDPDLRKKGYKTLITGDDYNTPEFEKNMLNLFMNDPVAYRYGEGNFNLFKEKLVGDLTANGRIYLGDKPKSQAITTNWAPKSNFNYFGRIGGLAIGQTSSNGSWTVTHTDKAVNELKVLDPATGTVRSIDATDVYQFDNISNASEGQDKSFTVGSGAIELNSGEKITGNTVRGKLEAIVKTNESFGVDKDGYSVIVLGPAVTTEEPVKIKTKEGKTKIVLQKVTTQPRYMVPYEPNAGKVQGMTIAPKDPDGFYLKDKSAGASNPTVTTNAAGQTEATEKKNTKKGKAEGNKSVNPAVKSKADALFGKK